MSDADPSDGDELPPATYPIYHELLQYLFELLKTLERNFDSERRAEYSFKKRANYVPAGSHTSEEMEEWMREQEEWYERQRYSHYTRSGFLTKVIGDELMLVVLVLVDQVKETAKHVKAQSYAYGISKWATDRFATRTEDEYHEPRCLSKQGLCHCHKQSK